MNEYTNQHSIEGTVYSYIFCKIEYHQCFLKYGYELLFSNIMDHVHEIIHEEIGQSNFSPAKQDSYSHN